MSIDLSNFDMYNYEFMLRPDGQTATVNVDDTKLDAISDNILKSQFMNIPSQYNLDPKSKVYFYLRDIHINNRDTLAIYSQAAQQKHYLQIKSSGKYNYTNFSGSSTGIGDTGVQNVQPGYALIPLNYQPVVVDNVKIPLRYTVDADEPGLEASVNLSYDIPATFLAGHYVEHPLLGTIYAGDDVESTTGELGNNESITSIPIAVRELNEGASEEFKITKIGSRKFVKALTLDKSTTILDRMVCINNPFGNTLEFQLVNVIPAVTPDKTVGVFLGTTSYDCGIHTRTMGGAVVISFSLLVEKSTTKY